MLKSNSRHISNSSFSCIFTHCCRNLFNFAYRPFKRVRISISSSTHLVKPSLNIAQVILYLFLFLSFAWRAQGPQENQPNHTVCTTGHCNTDSEKMVAKSCYVMTSPYVKHFGYFKQSNVCNKELLFFIMISFKWTYFDRISRSQTSVKFDPQTVLFKLLYQAMVVKNAIFTG